MVGGANRYHDPSAPGPRAPGARSLEAGPIFPAGLRGVLLAFLGIAWIGMAVQTVAAFDQDGRVTLQVALAMKVHGLFLFGVALMWGASESRHLSTGLRVGALVVGAFFVVQTAVNPMLEMMSLGWLF